MNTKESFEFYNDLRNGELGKVDIRNTIEKITNNDLVKLKDLEDDLEWYLGKDLNSLVMFNSVMTFEEEEEREWEKGTYSIKWQGKEVCKIKKPASRAGSIGEFILQPFSDNETLPNADYLPVCEVIKLLQRKIRDLQAKDQHKKPKSKPKLSDFFDLNKINVSKITKIQKAFKNFDGKSAGAVIYLLKDKYQLIEIIPNDSHGKNFKNFYKLFGFDGTSEGARKYVSKNHWFNESKNEQLQDEILSSIEKILKEILKQK